MPNAPRLRDFLKRLRDYGVVPHPNPARGKGSETVVHRPSKDKPLGGPTFPLTNHGLGKDVLPGQVDACLRRFGIDKKDFFAMM